MAPSAGPAEACPPAIAVAPHRLLEDGEIVILAIKPSAWFVALVSFPVVVAAAFIAALTFVGAEILTWPVPRTAIYAFCLAAVCLRALVASLQWMARLYIMTNRRLIRTSGVLREEVLQGPLRSVAKVTPAATVGERFVGVGSLFFDLAGDVPLQLDWAHLARPAEVQQFVTDAIARSR